MAEPTPDKKLLEYLSQFGIGNYQRIDLLLKELFPGEENLKGFLSIKATANIWAFLLDLKNNEFIKYHSDLIKGDDRVVMDIIVKAAIQLKGMEFLKRDFPTSGMNISGQHVNVISHSPSSRIEEKNTN